MKVTLKSGRTLMNCVQKVPLGAIIENFFLIAKHYFAFVHRYTQVFFHPRDSGSIFKVTICASCRETEILILTDQVHKPEVYSHYHGPFSRIILVLMELCFTYDSTYIVQVKLKHASLLALYICPQKAPPRTCIQHGCY